MFLSILRERKGKGENHRWTASCTPSTGNWGQNPGMCLDWDLLVTPNQLIHSVQGCAFFFLMELILDILICTLLQYVLISQKEHITLHYVICNVFHVAELALLSLASIWWISKEQDSLLTVYMIPVSECLNFVSFWPTTYQVVYKSLFLPKVPGWELKLEVRKGSALFSYIPNPRIFFPLLF